MEPWQIYKTVKGGISGNSRNSTVGCTKSKNHTNTPLYITIPLSDSESNLSLSLSLSLCNAPNGQQQRRTTEQLNKIIDHGVEADASTSPNRRNTHPQAPPEAMAEGGRTHQQPHSVERDPNRFNPQRDHHPLHLLLPLPLHHPHAPLQLLVTLFLSQIVGPFAVLSVILAGPNMGLALQERRGGPRGEDAAAGEGGQRVAGEVRGGVEEERVGV